MSWFKVDDAFHSSKPVMRIPRRYRAAAVGLWTLAGTWSSQEEMDGFVPEYVLEEVCGTPALAATLVRAGLWNEVTGESQEGSSVSGESGWQFRKWSDYNPLRSELEEKREAERIRKANYRKSQQRPANVPAGHPEGHQPESSPPDPTRPDPLKEEAKASSPRSTSKAKETPLANDWHPTEAHEERARENRLNLEAEVEAFRLHAETHGRRCVNWNSAFTTWLIKAKPQPTQQTKDIYNPANW